MIESHGRLHNIATTGGGGGGGATDGGSGTEAEAECGQ